MSETKLAQYELLGSFYCVPSHLRTVKLAKVPSYVYMYNAEVLPTVVRQ